MNHAHIVGWSHLPFGKFDHLDLETLVGQAATQALAHARIDASEIDAVFVGHAGMGMVPENFVSSYPMQAEPGLRFKPATRVENACATGTAAVYSAIESIEAGRARAVLVVGAEKMTAAPGADVTAALGNASYVREEAACGLTFPGIFARMAQAYFERYGDHRATLAAIAAKNHANGVRNPLGPHAARPRFRVLQHGLGEEPRRSPRHCARPIVRWCPTARPRWCYADGSAARAPNVRVRFRRAQPGQRFPADVAPRSGSLRRSALRLAPGVRAGRAAHR